MPTSWNFFESTSVCPRCGDWVQITRLLAGEHLCGPSAAEAHEAVGEDCDVLHDEIATFLAGSRGLRQAAFAQWCREHGRCA
jgi:hypothetical protein